MPLEIRPLVDYAFKKVFGSPENGQALISFLNAVLLRRRHIVDITLLNPFNEKEYDIDKLSILDIKAKDSSGAFFTIEMQLALHEELTKRWVYYACKQVSSQLEEGDDYGELCPVYSICIVDDSLWEDSEKLHHRFELADIDSGRVLTNTIEIHTLELGKYNRKESDLLNATPLECWLYWMVHAQEYESNELLSLFPENAFQQATHALETIKMKSTDLQRYHEREQALRDLGWQVRAARREGIKIGTIGKVQVLQELLGDQVASSTELESRTLEELERVSQELQQKLRNRSQSS